MSQVISANGLTDGLVVFFAAEGSWVGDIDKAALFGGKEEADAGLAAAKRDEARAKVVDPFLVDVKEGPEGRIAVSLRDMIRAKGPTISYLPVDPARVA